MAQLGQIALWIGLGIAVASAISLIYGIISKEKDFIAAGHIGVVTVFIFSFIASLVLLVSFLRRDFSLLYVASYSSQDLPLFYTFTAFWAGQQGSLLLWQLLLSFFTLVLLLAERRGKLLQWTFSILLFLQAFFLLLLAIPADPFKKAPMTLSDGFGLNPLLQHLQMAFHPPTLFVGYAAFAIPFALALAALITKEQGALWVERARRWTLFAWIFLGIGIFLGALWAYEVLGWGGYWGWDPVENASLFPWLTGAALLHSFTMYRKREMFKVWTILLAFLTFLLCILGTFITRSGIITSVHAFGESAIGTYFLWLMVVISVISIGLIILNRKQFMGESIQSLFSREYAYYLNNLILIIFTLIICVGTFFPVITELLLGSEKKVSLGADFYNSLAGPLGLTYLILIGVCPILGWKKESFRKFMKDVLYPLTIALVSGASIFFLWQKHFWGAFGYAVGIFAFSVILQAWLKEVQVRVKKKESTFLQAVGHLLKTGCERYGGLIAHIGIVLIVVGVIGSNVYKLEGEATLKRGETLKVGDIAVRYEDVYIETLTNKEVAGAKLTLIENGKEKGIIEPRLAFYFVGAEGPVSEVAVKRGLWRDVFAILHGIQSEDSVKVQLMLNPLVSWIWAGCLVLFLGAGLASFPKRATGVNFDGAGN